MYKLNTTELIQIARQDVTSFNLPELKRAGLIPLNESFFPAIYYPPLTMYPKVEKKELLKGIKYREDVPMALYIHIPFCPTKCTFCHWVTSINDTEKEMALYVECLLKEIDLWKKYLDKDTLSPRSILIGGGTPTQLSPALLKRFLDGLCERIDLSHCGQFSCEVEPRTVIGTEGIERLRILKAHGIKRISMGVQALDDNILKKMARTHNAQDVQEAIQTIRQVGFESLSIDLIYGYPDQSVETWTDTLEKALSLDIDAFQLYRLRIVPHGDKQGAIVKVHKRSAENFPPADNIYVMKRLGVIMSGKMNFQENFRRIFSKMPSDISFYLRDYCCRLYDVLGIGVSSWSNLQGRLLMNVGEDIQKYYAAIERGELPVDRGKVRTKDDDLRRALVLPLKNYGVSKVKYERLTGVPLNQMFGDKINKLKKFGLLEEDEVKLTLTPKGNFFADEVIMQFYHPGYLPFPEKQYAKGELNPFRHN